MNDRPDEKSKNQSNVEPQYAASSGQGGGRGRQGVGEAFFMSLIRQVARSIGTAIVRAVIGRR
jgi:hypothetical protein